MVREHVSRKYRKHEAYPEMSRYIDEQIALYHTE